MRTVSKEPDSLNVGIKESLLSLDSLLETLWTELDLESDTSRATGRSSKNVSSPGGAAFFRAYCPATAA
jgi:hypothetical protein